MRIMAQRGDTLIEVLLAITIFSAAAVGAIYVMNRGITTAQSSFEITQVRNQMNNQAELIRHLSNLAITAAGRITADGSVEHPSGGVTTQWKRALDRTIEEAPSFDGITTLEHCTPEYIANTVGRSPFFINTKTGDVVPINPIVPGAPPVLRESATFARIRDEGSSQVSEMIWVYAVRKPGDIEGRNRLGGDFYDFHIRACWHAPDGSGVQKLGTIVRLYAPED